MLRLRQSTAATVQLGPFVDDGDGKSAETGLTISQADVRISKNGGDMAQKNEASACTHDELGIYSCPLDATDTNTLGRLRIDVQESGALPVWHEFEIIPAVVYDSLIAGTDYLQADAVQVEGGDATDAIRDALVDDATRIDASALNTLSGRAPASTIAAASDIPAASAVADAVWDEASTGHTDAGKAGAQVWTDIDAIAVDVAGLDGAAMRGTDNAALAATALSNATWTDARAGYLDELGAANIPADIDTLLSRLSAARAGYLDKLNVTGTLAHSDAAASYMADVSALALEATLTAMKGGEWTVETLKAISDAIAALNNLSAAQVNAEVDTALADYDAPTKAELDSGLAGLNDLSSAEAQAAAAAALTAYDPPTKAELDSGLAGLNDLSAAEVNAEVDTALADYDAPTKAELDAGFLALVGADGDTLETLSDQIDGSTAPTAGEVADAVWDEALAAHSGAGSAGQALSAAGGAADPLLNEVPGSYASGTAGYALGRIDDIETAVDGISGGSGAHAITLYVKDEDGNPIAGAAVSIPTAGTQTSAASTGAVNFNLDAGTYTATIRSSAAYTPDASYTVTVNASGAVTAPADAVLEVASASLPAPTSPDNYLLWCDETQIDYGDVAFGEGEMTVEIVRMSQAARKNVDDNKYRSFVQRSFSTDANGQWSIEIPKDVVEAGGTLTLRRQYTDENGYPVTEDTTVILDADMAEDDDTLAWTSLQSTDNE